MSTSTATPTVARTTSTARTEVPTWAMLKASYKQAETSGKKAQRKAYDTIVRAYGLTDATETDKKGTVVARSDRARGREVLDALTIEAGNVFGLTDVRVTQVARVYLAIGSAGADPFSEAGQALYAQFETIRRNDVTALDKASNAVKGASADKKAGALSDAVDASKKAAKERAAAKKAENGKSTATAVDSLKAVTTFAEGILPMVRKVSATATPEEKAAAKKALEALLAHLA